MYFRLVFTIILHCNQQAGHLYLKSIKLFQMKKMKTAVWLILLFMATLSTQAQIITEGFDGTTFPPTGWTNTYTVGGSGNVWNRVNVGTNPNTSTHSGAGMIQYNSYVFATGNRGQLITPPLDLSVSIAEVKFSMYRDGSFSNYKDSVNVYYNTNPSTTGATLLGSINRYSNQNPVAGTPDMWYDYKFILPAGSVGTNRYIIIEGVSGWGGNIYIDDFQVGLPPTCISPSTLIATEITSASAKLGWTAGGTETAWTIEYGASGFVQGAGTQVSITSNSQVISGLSANTNYQFYVQANCGVTDGSSTWTGPFSFTTNVLCPQPTSLALSNVTPFSVQFAWAAGGSETSWNIEYGAVGFAHGAGTTINGVTSPHTINNLTPETNYDLYVRANCGGTDGSSVWAGPFYVATLISCPKPKLLTASNLTTTSAQLAWTAGGTETAWNIEYGPAGFAHGAGTTVNGITNPYTLNGLASATGYEYYVKADCGGINGSSSWAGPFSFYTTCTTVNVPYFENFDNNLTPNLLPCITVTNNNGDANEWGIVNFASNSAPSSFAIFNNSEMAMNDWFFTPGLNLESTKTYKLTFSYQGGNLYSSASEKLEVKFGTSANAASMTSTQIFNNTNILSGTFISASNTFTVPANGVYYIGFHAFSNIISNTLVLDDVSIVEDLASACAAPTALEATNLTTTTATLGWANSAPDFNIRYRKAEGTNPWILATAASNTLAISSLVENKQYEFQVQAICSPTETSDWTPSTLFQTLSSTVCTTPINLQAYNITEESAKIVWTHSALYFNVRHRVTGSSTWIYNQNIYYDLTLTGLASGTSYECQSQAKCSSTPGDTSAWSLPVNFTTVAHSCFAPTNLTATSITETSALLGWTSSAPDFVVRHRIVNDPTWTITNTSTNSLALSSLSDNTDYEFQVYALCSGNSIDTSEWTAVSTFSTSILVVTCNAPSALTVTAMDAAGATLNWTAGGTETAWNIRHKKVADATYTEDNNTITKPYILTSLQSGTAYVWNVKAVCSVTLSSEWSAENTFTTTVGIENNSLNNLSVYSYNNQVNVINNDNLLIKAVVIYDMIGQEVATYAINSTDNILINTNFTSGNYVVKIVTDTQVMTKKLNIK